VVRGFEFANVPIDQGELGEAESSFDFVAVLALATTL